MSDPHENVISATEDSEHEEGHIAERLSWTPKQRIQYLLDMLAFEERPHRARRLS
jgi:hypothetical protein